jgi:HAD superfamily hydrolase (TIGR01484 family)
MENIMIKLIATDIDGTLLHNDRTLPEEFPFIRKKLKENDIIFAVASGRPYLTLCKNFPDVNKDLLYIADNGAHVVYQDKELSVHILDHSMVEKLITIADELNLTLSQLALAWILRQPMVASALIGASKPSQIEENIKASGVTLSEETLERIEKILSQG